jgi:hypothetical protein
VTAAGAVTVVVAIVMKRPRGTQRRKAASLVPSSLLRSEFGLLILCFILFCLCVDFVLLLLFFQDSVVGGGAALLVSIALGFALFLK